jgi:hypothetical protein
VSTDGASAARVARRDDVLWRRTFGEVLMLLPQSEEPLVLDEQGALIWDLLADSPTVDEMTQTLCDHFQTDPALIERDLLAFIDELEHLGAVVPLSSR